MAEPPRKTTLPASADAPAAVLSHGSTVTFDNRSGEPALVKLVGPIGRSVEVPDGTQRTVDVAGGEHYILVRYGADPKRYTYTRGNPFVVKDDRHRVSRITLTLHKVVHGNYPSRPASRDEFERAGPAAPGR